MAENNNTMGNAILDQAEKVASYTNGDKKYNEKNLQNTQTLAEQENKIIENQRMKDYIATADNVIKQQEAAKLIDDGYFQSLPKSIVRMYKDGDFGDISTKEGKKRAKNTMGLAIVGTLADALGNIGNSVSAVGGIQGTYQNKNFIDKIRNTNLEEGLKNKWEKQKQTTQNAIDIVKKRGLDEEEAQSAVQRLTSNARMQSQFNRMTQDEKAYAIQVQKEIGEEIGSLTNPEALQLISGMLASGASVKECALLIGIRYAPDSAKAIYSKLTGQEMPSDISELVDSLGDKVTTGVSTTLPNGKHEVKMVDGQSHNVGILASKNDFNTLNTEATKLENMYLNGQISKEEYLERYGAIYDEWEKHPAAKKLVGTFEEPESYVNGVVERQEKYIAALEERKKAKADKIEAQTALTKATTREEKTKIKADIKQAEALEKEAQKKIDNFNKGKQL